MRNAVMLIHDGGWPDAYLNISTFFRNIGVFIYDNRAIDLEKSENFEGVSTVIYLVSSEKMLQKMREITSLPRNCGIIFPGRLRKHVSFLSAKTTNAQAKLFCSDDIAHIMDFSLQVFASGETNRYRTLSDLYAIFKKNQLIPSYYCAQYMLLSTEEWKGILGNIVKAVQQFEYSRGLPNTEYVLFSSGIGMKRANDICRKIFNQTQTKWSLLIEEQALLFEEKKIIIRLEAAYRADSDLKLALIYLNDVLQRNHPNIDGAQYAYETCMEAPMLYYVYFKWGLLLQRMKDSRAKNMFLRSVEMNPGCYRSQYRLGLLYEKENAFEEAKSCYKQIIRILSRPKSAHPVEFEYLYKALYRLGNVYTETGQLSSALNQYKKANWLWNTLVENDFMKCFLNGLVKDPVVSVKNRIRKNVLDACIANVEMQIQRGKEYEKEGSLPDSGFFI